MQGDGLWRSVGMLLAARCFAEVKFMQLLIDINNVGVAVPPFSCVCLCAFDPLARSKKP
jgi:hypothetical protein